VRGFLSDLFFFHASHKYMIKLQYVGWGFSITKLFLEWINLNRYGWKNWVNKGIVKSLNWGSKVGSFDSFTVKKVTDFPVFSRDVTYQQGCKWNERSLNRGLNRGRGQGIDVTFFWESCSNLEIDENFRISHKLSLGLAAKISQAFAIQLDRFRGQ
jgi:hypothetical protein